MTIGKQVTFIEDEDWDALVQDTYGRVYCLQQQDGCKERGVESFRLPLASPIAFKNDSVPEEVNHDEMGVSLKGWLSRNPGQKLNTKDEWDRDHGLRLWWERNFYPSLGEVAQDLYDKGVLPAGEYVINIDW